MTADADRDSVSRRWPGACRMPFVKLEAILFDLGRVIVDFDMAECESTLIAHSGLDPDRFLRVVWDTGWIRRH